MMKSLSLITFLFLFSSQAHALLGLVHLEPYVGLGLGESTFTEDSSGTSYTHDGYNLGYSVGLRGGLSLGPFSLGLTGSYGQQQIEMTRDANGVTTVDKPSYDLGLINIEKGVFAAFYLVKVYFLAEYFFDVDGKLKRAESDVANPFSKNDKLSGSGFSLGIGYRSSDLLNIALLYKRTKYDELPSTSSSLSPFRTNALNLQFSILF